MTEKCYIWTEKYRPKKYQQLLDQNKIKDYINGAIKNKNIMHTILYGPPGTGKTSVSKIIINAFFKYKKSDFPNNNQLKQENINLYKERVLELNASDERGIQIVRDQIKKFAAREINKSNINKNIPPIKLIILDEVDHMAQDAQFALRRIMEDYSEQTRFILICNYITKIIEPIISRCGRFSFAPVSIESMIDMMKYIYENEGYGQLQVQQNIYEYIYNWTKGDMRKSIILFQQLCHDRVFTIEKLQSLNGDTPTHIIQNIINTIQSPFDTSIIMNAINVVFQNGYNIFNILNNLYNHYLFANIDDTIKGKIFIKLSQTNYKLNSGCSEKLQIINLIMTLNAIYNGAVIKETYGPYSVSITPSSNLP